MCRVQQRPAIADVKMATMTIAAYIGPVRIPSDKPMRAITSSMAPRAFMPLPMASDSHNPRPPQ
jgi:hypothetical protein